MSIEITSTKDAATNGLKLLVYGNSGVGKTRLCGTTGDLENTIIISAEAGLLSLREFDIDAIAIKTMADLAEAYKYIVKAEHKKYLWVCLDSISEIAETVLAAEMAETDHGMKAYGEMQTKMMALIKRFRDLDGVNVYFSCKSEFEKDENGAMVYQPSLPGKKLTQGISYYFDEVFCLRTALNDSGEDVRVLQAQPDNKYAAKDRSGALNKYEKPDLAAIAAKISHKSEEK